MDIGTETKMYETLNGLSESIEGMESSHHKAWAYITLLLARAVCYALVNIANAIREAPDRA